ncbi:MAG: hypothetical protein IT184_14930 [Acidobacteria bacterium]|nr:hypothetical protein [Acidobacteriota bacterium]
MPSSLRRLALPAFAGYCLLAVLQTWPLALHLSTHVTGIPGGDTGVYVWNTWVFRHELLERQHWPFSTSMVLLLAGAAPLGLHNYTAAADLLTLPLQPWLGVVGAFNVVFMLGIALSGLGMFVLAHHVTGRAAVSWVAGAMFAASPFLVARGTAHFSLASAAALPFFLYWFDVTWQHRRVRDAALAGVAVAWAAYSDPYYAIYCAMLAVVVAAVRVVEITIAGRRQRGAGARRTIDVVAAALVVVMTTVYGLSGGTLRAGAGSVSMRTLYTPMLLLSVLVAARVLLTWTFAVRWRPLPSRIWIGAIVMATTAAILMAPELYALGQLAAESRFVRAPVLWRSSAPGADLLAFLLPNPNHPWAPSAIVDWVARQPGRYEENVLSISWVAAATIFCARRAGLRIDRLWLVITIGFALLAFGPFLRVAGHQTFVPTPWTFLRYLPVIGDARMPQRFGILMFLGLSAIFAQALAAILHAAPASRGRTIVAAVAAALAIELLPAPRPLYTAATPDVYRTIADDPRPASVLEVPFGVRDGLSSIGNFGPGSLLYQTTHRKPIVGGYLSRVDERTKAIYEQHPYASVLIAWSEERQPQAEALQRAANAADAFVAQVGLGWVVVDRDRVPDDARRFLITTLHLQPAGADGPLELYRVR